MSPSTTSTPSPPTTTPGSTSTIARAPEALIAQIQKLLWQLAASAPPAHVPGLQLAPADCNRLEETTGFGTTRSPEELVKAVERLASMKVGDIRIPFSPGQLAELQYRAAKRGRSVETEMRAVVARIEEELFYKGG